MERGDERSEAFAAWYRVHHPRVFASMLAISGDREMAAEVADEAFVRALERWERVRVMAAPEGWVWVVARNALRALHRRESRRRRSEMVVARTGGPGTYEPDLEVEVWDAIWRLPRRQREVIALRYLLGLTEAEVARALRLAPGTVARTLHDARARLAAALRDPHTELERP